MKNKMFQAELIKMAGQALAGMMANPNWMAYAKEEAALGNRGDVPDQFARIATLYAERTLNKVCEEYE